VVKPLAGWTRSVQQHAAHRDWESLVEKVRKGPARWWPSRIGPVDAAVNGVEFFVHHEDVRRAQPQWQARTLDPAVQEALWRAVGKLGSMYLRSAPVGVVLANRDGRRVVAKDTQPSVTVTGEPAELVLLMHGRGSHALVDISGDDVARQRFHEASFSI